jgi:hypothetical protein
MIKITVITWAASNRVGFHKFFTWYICSGSNPNFGANNQIYRLGPYRPSQNRLTPFISNLTLYSICFWPERFLHFKSVLKNDHIVTPYFESVSLKIMLDAGSIVVGSFYLEVKPMLQIIS